MENKSQENKYVDFVVEVRKYKTLLNKKFEERKPWVKPYEGDVVAHLPGTIVELDVTVGEYVEEGQLLLIHEAMKMHNRVVAPIKGQITAVNVNTGDRVPKDFLMVKIEPK